MKLTLGSASSNTALWAVLAGTLFVVIVILMVSLPSDEEGPSMHRDFSLPCRAVPEWQQTSTVASQAVDLEEKPSEVAVYLDTSHSMGGFLPPTSEDQGPGFRAAVQLVPGHLVGVFGGSISWQSIDENLRGHPRAPRFSHALFTGSATRLEVALQDLITNLHEGRLAAAAVVTDLVANGGPEGAMGAAEPLQRWLEDPEVRTGTFDLGVLGVRAPYWGVRSSSCPRRGELGCWYSEHGNGYRPLSHRVERPFYLLVFGRSSMGSHGTLGTNLVDLVGQDLVEDFEALGLEVYWELLTRTSRTFPGTVTCKTSRVGADGVAKTQYALYRRDGGAYECRRDDPVHLACCVTLGGAQQSGPCGGSDPPLELAGARASWEFVSVEASRGELITTLDSERLRDAPPDEDLRFEHVVAEIDGDGVGSWEEWSARSDEFEDHLTGTLQMDVFIETVRLRPDHYRIDIDQPLLRVEDSDD